MPVSHLTLTVSHLPTSTSFFLSCLQSLGYQFVGRCDDYIGFGQKQGEPADFWITEQKPGTPASAVHVAFPAPSKDAVGEFFIAALKAGGKIHGEPKLRDEESGYYSAAVIDFDGNSIEAVYRDSADSSPSEMQPGSPAMSRIDTSSAVLRAKSLTGSQVSHSKPGSRDEKSLNHPGSKAPTIVEYSASNSQADRAPIATQPSSSATYHIYQASQQTTDDGSKAAKTIVGALLGAAAGAAIAYAMVKGDSQSQESTIDAPPQYAPPSGPTRQVSPWDLLQLAAPLQAPSTQRQPSPALQAIEAPPPRSAPRSTSYSRSMASKNPRAETIYTATESHRTDNETRSPITSYPDDQIPRRASDGSVYTTTQDLALRTIEYAPKPARSGSYPCNPSTFISSYHAHATDKLSKTPKEASVCSSSTLKPSKAPDPAAAASPHSSSHSHHTSARQRARSMAAASSLSARSTRSARNVPLPESSVASASYRSAAETVRSAAARRLIPLPADSHSHSLADVDVDRHYRSYHHQPHANFARDIAPSDSISQVGRHRDRDPNPPHSPSSSHSHWHPHSYSHAHRRSHSQSATHRTTHSARRSRASSSSTSNPNPNPKPAAAGSRALSIAAYSSIFDEPVKPSDSISQVSSNASSSTRTVRAVSTSKASKASKAESRVRGNSAAVSSISTSHRASQAW